jgi:hypothetical protein
MLIMGKDQTKIRGTVGKLTKGYPIILSCEKFKLLSFLALMSQQENVIMHDLHMLLFTCASFIDSI